MIQGNDHLLRRWRSFSRKAGNEEKTTLSPNAYAYNRVPKACGLIKNNQRN